MIELSGGMFLLLGSAVVLIGSFGLLRLPDCFSRLHAAGVVDTLGAWLVLLGLLILSASVVVAFKVLLLIILLFFLSPVNSHGLSKAALKSGLSPHTDASSGNSPSTTK